MADDRIHQAHREVERDNPYERQRQFLEERLAPLRPKAGAGAADAPSGLDATGLEGEPQRRLPSDFRRRLVEQYRRRQRAEVEARQAARPVQAADEQENRSEAKGSPQLPPATWFPIGPSVVRQGQSPARPPTSGRVSAIAVAPGGRRVYVGAANGGIWRSDDAGQTWQSCMESESFDLNPPAVPEQEMGADSLSVGALAIDPNDPDKIYVGTGEGLLFGYFGVGPILSTDGGATWSEPEATAPGSPKLAGSRFYALAVDPNVHNQVVAATDKGLYRREPDGGGGFHWVYKLPPAGKDEPTSVVAARSGTTTTFYTSGPEGRVSTSADGAKWEEIGTGVPGTDDGPAFPGDDVAGVGLAVQPTNPTVVYALVARKNKKFHGLYRLDRSDGGAWWRRVLGVPADLFGDLGEWGGGHHTSAIAVDPVDFNRVYLGGTAASVPIADTEDSEFCAALYRCAIISAGRLRTTPAHIGATVHADMTTLVFAPDDPNTLWVGCDGGAFVSTNPAATDARFQARNTGLATLQMHHFGQHPIEDAVLFCGTQDNGGLRFTGEPAWLYSAGGDCGYFVVNWADPYQVLSTFTDSDVRRSTDGGSRYSYSNVNVPLEKGEPVHFYAPLVGTPHNPAAKPADAKAEAEVVAFGSIRPWISYEFGDGWQSIPKNKLANDSLDAEIRSLAFASATMLYAGTMGGGVYRFVRTGTKTWKRDPPRGQLGGAATLPPRPITGIAVDPADPSGKSIYVTLGGTGDYRHVWHFNGTQSRWQQRSGPEAGHADSLLDVHSNAIVVDPANPSHLYVGADIGIWRSTDRGATWSTFSSGLPDVAVIDLALHPGGRLLRAATHGRGVYECRLDATSTPTVQLYVRDTQLDMARFATEVPDQRADPTRQGRRVYHWAGPDIKLDIPDASGRYQLPITPPTTVDFLQFTDTLTDGARKVATYATQAMTSRVYVQVHNRGVRAADNVQVMLLVANASVALPALPSDFAAKVRSGTPINTPDWQTVGVATLDGVRPGRPKIAAFDLTSDKLPAPDQPAGNNHHGLLALVHHPDDPFTATQTAGDRLTVTERKAAHKQLRTLQFVEVLEKPPPAVLRVRLNNPDASRRLLTDLVANLETVDKYGRNPYPGRVRVVLPTLQLDGALQQRIEGLRQVQDNGDFTRWANQQRKHLFKDYNEVFVQQQVRELDQFLAPGTLMLQAVDKPERPKQVAVRRIVMGPSASHTVFVLFDRPNRDDYGPGRAFDVEVMQFDAEQGTQAKPLGGLSSRIELASPAIYRPG